MLNFNTMRLKFNLFNGLISLFGYKDEIFIFYIYKYNKNKLKNIDICQ